MGVKMSNWQNILKVQVLDNKTSLNVIDEPMSDDDDDCLEVLMERIESIIAKDITYMKPTTEYLNSVEEFAFPRRAKPQGKPKRIRRREGLIGVRTLQDYSDFDKDYELEFYLRYNYDGLTEEEACIIIEILGKIRELENGDRGTIGNINYKVFNTTRIDRSLGPEKHIDFEVIVEIRNEITNHMILNIDNTMRFPEKAKLASNIENLADVITDMNFLKW